MKAPFTILLTALLFLAVFGKTQAQTTHLNFFGDTVVVPAFQAAQAFSNFSSADVQAFAARLSEEELQPYLAALLNYRKQKQLDDWLYYQLVRKVAQALSPKAENYYRYTLYKWWLLTRSGYDARLTCAGPYLLFYVQSDEAIYNIPYRVENGQQYVCLNYHDYGNIDFNRFKFEQIPLPAATTARPFSYKINHLPAFKTQDYVQKELQFADGSQQYHFRLAVNPQVKTLFTNYPVVDYAVQFEMPLSQPTYESLIPSLKKEVHGMKQRDGVEFLMRFTRYAFLFKPDMETFGGEKRLTPEQTLLYEYSDCEDRAALFFFLVKEIYNLPMLVLAYPQHVTVAIQFEKPFGKTIEYNGNKYSICEPSPQKLDLRAGQILPELSKKEFQVAYAYRPAKD